MLKFCSLFNYVSVQTYSYLSFYYFSLCFKNNHNKNTLFYFYGCGTMFLINFILIQKNKKNFIFTAILAIAFVIELNIDN